MQKETTTAIISKMASSFNRRDEAPNRELAKQSSLFISVNIPLVVNFDYHDDQFVVLN